MADSNVLAEALTLYLRQVEGEYAAASADADRALAAAKAASDRAESLKLKREHIAAELRSMGVAPPLAVRTMVAMQMLEPSTLVATLHAAPPPAAPVPTTRLNRRAWRQDVIEKIAALLAQGRRMHAGEILEALQQEGVSFEGVENARHRLVQIMSESQQFAANRKIGWGLREFEFPTIDVASSASVEPVAAAVAGDKSE